MLLVLRRLVKLTLTQAQLEATNEAALKQAKGASDQARKLMDENEKLLQGGAVRVDRSEDGLLIVLGIYTLGI